MPIIATDSGGGDFALPEAGLTQAVCAFVEDVGEEWSEKFGHATHKIIVCWELTELMEDKRPFMLSQRYTLSLNEKANLRRDLESWRGRPFTAEELKGFDVEKLIGVNAMVNVVHYTGRDGKERAKIASVSPTLKGSSKLLVQNKEPPEWIGKLRDENKKAAAERAAKDAADEPDPPAPEPGADEVPF
jgi:hypothetical protein